MLARAVKRNNKMIKEATTIWPATPQDPTFQCGTNSNDIQSPSCSTSGQSNRNNRSYQTETIGVTMQKIDPLDHYKYVKTPDQY